MSVTVACACGTIFEVQDSSAGQMVECPKCEQPARAGRAGESAVRTSGLALAGLILALSSGFALNVGLQAFSAKLPLATLAFLALLILGPAMALFFAVLGYIAIARSQGALKGYGYCIGAIVATTCFGGLAALLSIKTEIIEIAQERLSSDRLRFDGDLRRVYHDRYFAIERPNQRWGVTRQPEHLRDTARNGIILVCPSRRITVQVVNVNDFYPSSLTELHESVMARFGLGSRRFGISVVSDWNGTTLVEKPKFTQTRNAERMDFELQGEYRSESRRALVRLVKFEKRYYEVWAISPAERLEANEEIMRQVLNSFEPLTDAWRPTQPF